MVFMSIVTVITIITCIVVAGTLQTIKRIDNIEILRHMVCKGLISLTIILVLTTINGWVEFVF